MFPLTNNNHGRSRSSPSPSAVADGLRAVVSTDPANVGKMLSAPGETVDALVDRLAGVMSVNSLSAEAVLARFFSQDLLASHLVDALGKSGKGNPATLAARIVAQWKPGKPTAAGIKRKSRGEVAAAALAASGGLANATAPPPPSGPEASSVPTTGPDPAPETATADAEPKNKHARSEPTVGTAPVRPPSGAARAGPGSLRSPSFGFLSPDVGPAAARPAVRDTFIVRDPRADVTDDGAAWVTHASQDDALTANWRMRRVHFDRSENGGESVATSTTLTFRDGSVSLRTRHCGVVKQRARDYNQITPKGLVYKVDRGGCPLCCGDEVFLLTMQIRADPAGTGTGTGRGRGRGRIRTRAVLVPG